MIFPHSFPLPVSSEILLPEEKIKCLGQLITFKNAVEVEFEHRIRVGNIHEPQAGVDVTKVPTERQIQIFRRHSDTITLLRCRNVDNDGRNEAEAPDNATTDDEDGSCRQRETGKGCAAAHATSVDDTADVEPHDLDSEQEDDTTEHNNQDLNEHVGAQQD